MDERNSLLIASLTGQILTRDPPAVQAVLHTPERSLDQKLDALADLIGAVSAAQTAEVRANSALVAQNNILRQRAAQTAVTFLRRARQVGVPASALDQIQSALQQYETYVNNDGLDGTVIDGYLSRAEAAYADVRGANVVPFLKRAESQTQAAAPTVAPPAQLYALIAKFRDPRAIERVGNADIQSALTHMTQNVEGAPLIPVRIYRASLDTIKDEDARLLFDLYLQQDGISYEEDAQAALDRILGPYGAAFSNESEAVIAAERDFDRMDIEQLTEYIKHNYSGQFDFNMHNSVNDVREFAKTVWRANKTPMPEQSWQTPAPTPMPERSWQTPAPTPMPEQSWQTPAPTPMPERSWQTPAPTPMPEQSWQTPAPTPMPERSWQTPAQDQNLQAPVPNADAKRRRVPSSDEEEVEVDFEAERKRRRQEDKDFLRVKAKELAQYAGVNERMERIVKVTRAMQRTYDYCNCKNTIKGTPDAATFEKLLQRLNTYDLAHVEMTVNFYELLYPLTLYNDEDNRIAGYIFAAANYFQNCAKNFGQMRAQFNAHGAFAQIDSMVMFVIKFNFLCDLQAFFGQIDNLPTLGQPNIKTHNVLIMRDKIVKLAFNALQYNTVVKTENRRDPKHLRRVIMLMNADFNVI
uniref:Viral capsid associated protein n=1 Tax=Antheraea pernyi nuclear polyhedrosis virus TaxID=161494 RepID=A8C613_NPVAP|nr:viral capsid associated protein [Antheraea pernyi nucleopolyhedrovirus]BAX08824.1 viral capsid associated protein [Antheraea pernyi nucleopolyhedrovirus]BBD50966.1 viral capsid associated protein [Antheraea pernyi nucleopolyhedrovirus]